MRRTIDLAVASALGVLLAPVILVVALVVRIALGGPVLFRQERAGRHGRPFTLYKFRTMRPQRADEVGPQHDAARTGRVGAFLRATSLDELPSLLNVLRGEMGLVGPRPLPMSYVARYTREQARRLDIRPGITGWAVVNGRNLLSWDERFALDVWYVEHRSWRLDLRILWRTAAMVARRTGVNHSGGVTMHEFRPPGDAS